MLICEDDSLFVNNTQNCNLHNIVKRKGLLLLQLLLEQSWRTSSVGQNVFFHWGSCCGGVIPSSYFVRLACMGIQGFRSVVCLTSVALNYLTV